MVLNVMESSGLFILNSTALEGDIMPSRRIPMKIRASFVG
jgi:hypothetical protein